MMSGKGQLIPFGQATETIEFGACGEGCDFCTINLAEGSIFSEEAPSNPDCPGTCQPNRAEPSFGTLTDVIVGGTGILEGATGTLTGTVRAAGPQSQLKALWHHHARSLTRSCGGGRSPTASHSRPPPPRTAPAPCEQPSGLRGWQTYARARIRLGRTGLEPVTSGLSSRRSPS
jgi:hypothetical protein